MCNQCYDQASDKWKRNKHLHDSSEPILHVGDLVIWTDAAKEFSGNYYDGYWKVDLVREEARGIVTYKLSNDDKTFNRAVRQQLELVYSV